MRGVALVACALVCVSALAVAVSAVPLGPWLADHYKDEAAGGGLTKIVTKLERMHSLKTTEQLLALGKDGVRKLHGIPKSYRQLLLDALVHHLGLSKGYTDESMVTVPKPKPKKVKRVDECGELSLLEMEVAQSAEATPLGKFLLKRYPEDKKKLKPILKKLEGQMIWSFKDLAALGSYGIEALHVPKKYKSVLKDALVTHIGRKNKVSDRMVPVPEGYRGLWKKKLAALRAARAKAKRCTQVRLKNKQRRQRKHKRNARRRKAKKCSAKGGCIGRYLPVLYYPIPHTQDLPPWVHETAPEYTTRD